MPDTKTAMPPCLACHGPTRPSGEHRDPVCDTCRVTYARYPKITALAGSTHLLTVADGAVRYCFAVPADVTAGEARRAADAVNAGGGGVWVEGVSGPSWFNARGCVTAVVSPL